MAARETYRRGAAARRPTARYYRSWAALEKRAGELQASYEGDGVQTLASLAMCRAPALALPCCY